MHTTGYEAYVYIIYSKACSSPKVHQPPCSVSPPYVVVVVVFRFEGPLKTVFNPALAVSQGEASQREGERKENMFDFYSYLAHLSLKVVS